MKIYNSLDDFKVDCKTIVTIGTFDGVHLGHRYIINHLNKIAKKVNGESVLLTFSPHPRLVIHKENSTLKLIDTIEEKKIKLEKIGLKHLIIQEFSKDFSRMKYVNFVRDVLVKKLNVDYLVIGYDHHFGRNREGSINELRYLSDLYNFNLEQIPPQKDNDIAVSSTKIRNLIDKGDIIKANRYLGHAFILRGKVIHGEKIGRQIGFPTANIETEKNKLIPKSGVYFVNVYIEKKIFNGMLNIGSKNKIEVHIFDFKGDLYGQKIEIEFLDWIRPTMTFKNNEDLRLQLQKDKLTCQKIIVS